MFHVLILTVVVVVVYIILPNFFAAISAPLISFLKSVSLINFRFGQSNFLLLPMVLPIFDSFLCVQFHFVQI